MWYQAVNPKIDSIVTKNATTGSDSTSESVSPGSRPGAGVTPQGVITDQMRDEVQRVLADTLKKRKQRQTPERFAVLDEVYATVGHFDADELYIRLKNKGVHVSRATVYNTLDLLIECNLVVRHQFDSKHSTYERGYSYRQHDHLICLDCDQLFEFCDPRLQAIQEMVGEIYQMQIKSHSLHMYGECIRDNCPNRK